MASPANKVVSWGIIGCGWISSEFVKGITLLRDDVDDVYHSIAAVGSRDVAKAESFIKENCPKGANAQQLGLVDYQPQPCGSYDEVYRHPNVDIIYIGTPNTSHFADAKTALEAGKNVLLEKPATLNAKEWERLRGIAKEKGVFLMEAMWTRFLPISYVLQEEIFDKKTIGDVRGIHADFSMSFIDHFPKSHRTLNPDLAGGPLMDLGPYTLNIAMLALYLDPRNEKTKPSVKASMLMCETGCDLTTGMTLGFEKLGAVASLTNSFAYNNSLDVAAKITGTKGEILIHGPGLSGISKITIRQIEGEESVYAKFKDDVVVERAFPGFGLHFEADAVARSLKAGEVENARMPHDDTALVMEIFDEVRRQGGYKFPAEE